MALLNDRLKQIGGKFERDLQTPPKKVSAQNQAAIDAYYARRKKKYILDHWSGPITGVGETQAEAKKDAIRQGNMMSATPPANHFVNTGGDKVSNTAEHRSRWYKYRSHESARWDKAIQLLTRHLTIAEIAYKLRVKEVQVLNWKKKLTVPDGPICDPLMDLLSQYVSKTDLCRCCNLTNGQGR